MKQSALLLLCLFSSIACGQESDPEWLLDIDSITVEDLPQESPWFGSFILDNHWSIINGEAKRQEWTLTLGVEKDLTSRIRLRTSFLLRHDTLPLWGRREYVDYRQRQNQAEIYEAFASVKFSPETRLNLGRQKIGLGYSQGFRVLDAISPIDARVPAYGELSQLKLPQASMSMEILGESHSERIFWFAERRADRTYHDGDFGIPSVDFSSYSGFDNWLYSHSQQFEDFDFKLVIGDTFNPALQNIGAEVFYQNERWVGLAANYVLNETNWYYEQRLVDSSTRITLSSNHQSDIDGLKLRQQLLGLRYQGFKHLTISGEYLFQNTGSRDDDQYFLNVSMLMLRDTLQIAWLHTGFIDRDTKVDQLILDYSWFDGMHLKVGVLLYTADANSSMYDIDEQDRAYLSWSYYW